MLAGGAAVVLAGVLLVARWRAWREFRLPEELRVEEVTADLSATLDPKTVVEDSAADHVRMGTLKPGHDYDVHESARPAIVAPPPARLRLGTHVPPDATFRFSIGVEGERKVDREAAGIRFAVSLDGTEVFSRVVNPAGRHGDRQWFDEEIDLARVADRDVELTLATTPERPSARLAGTPGWSHLHVVRTTHRARQPLRPDAPNVLVVLIDTLRADRLGCYGADPSPTPNLDAFARRGRVFEQTVAQAPWTTPSVASIFTGLYPRSHGAIGDQFDGPPADGGIVGSTFLADALHTFAEHAAGAGVTTVAVSGNPLISRGANFAQGFETFVEFNWDRVREDWIPAGDVNAAFLRWLDRNHRERFLGYLHFMEPHDPYRPQSARQLTPPAGLRPEVLAGRPARLPGEMSGGTAPLPPAELAYLHQLYDREVAEWDAAFGVVLHGLEAAGVLESTVVVVTADHGEEFQEHGRLRHVVHLYDESIHVPLVIVGPGIAPGRSADQAQGVDLYPTIVALLGLPPVPGLPGRNLLAPGTPGFAFSETRYGALPGGGVAPIVALRTPAWKLIWAPSRNGFELFDLGHDAAERENRIGSEPAGAALAEALAAWRTAAPPPPAGGGQDPAMREKLRALGYVQ
jgi:arylsulfatase A-like enzyme